MALILHIDTALQRGNVGIAKNGESLWNVQSDDQYNHAAFVQPAIEEVLKQSGYRLTDVDAIGVIAGPGSYTGIRVAMASAKGLCYALNKPLLTVNTLEVMTLAAIEKFPAIDVYCPMIDARRNEVFTALYNERMELVMPVQALILDETSFEQQLSYGKIIYFGNGSDKFKNIIKLPVNALFEQVGYDGAQIAKSLLNSFKNNVFQDLAYSEPMYVKDFYLGKNT